MKASRLHTTRLVLATVLISAAVLAETSAAARVKTVSIINVYSHHPVDIVPGGRNGSTRPYANAFLWKNAYCPPASGLPCQEYDLIYSANGNGLFKIRVRRSELCLMLDFRDLPYRNGTRVIQYNCNATKVRSRWWYVKRVKMPPPPGERESDYPYMLLLVNNATGDCLDADNGAGGAPPRGAVLQNWECFSYSDDWNVGNQLWRFD